MDPVCIFFRFGEKIKVLMRSRHKNKSPVLSDWAWWGKVDSNHRSDKQQIYSLSPLATREFPQLVKLSCVSHATKVL